ncbi:MAG TPA: T9SS type A sorting domain-containing protein [candidate division WOR-3 bacterium]|uniref:T9SS type A sorting domain-containing protein n=1 Tax=candidate division WOR-3 bacterium TaxID=2052148 RepID=A0A7V0XFD8_UNCW3|nr:T9SS type A sorting domain-containing protein [candidate division WOR-3 bacterium]
MMRRLSFGLLVLAMTVSLAGGAVSWQSRFDGGVLSLDIPVPAFHDADNDAGSFVALELSGAGLSDEYGAPALPVYRRLVEVPHGAVVSLTARPGEVTRYEPARVLLPVQFPVPKSGPAPEFALDEKLYAQDGWYGEIGARLVEAGVMRGHRLVLVEITPARYNPVQGVLELAQGVSVQMNWIGADWGQTRARAERYDNTVFRNRLAGVTVNHGDFGFSPPPDLPVGYLIIVPDDWEENVRPLAEWRRRRGHHVFVRNLSQVGGGAANTVRNFIKDAYDNWPVPPSFVLLVGDVDRIGHFTGQGTGSPPTDLNFALLDGDDYLPDLDLSRASLANAAQLDTFVHNVITYEQAGGTGGRDWLNRAYFIASNDAGFHQVAEATHAHVMQKLRGYGLECDSLWLYYNQGTPIAEAINAGRAWVTYSGHGSTTSWADPSPSFGIPAVRNLTNVDMIPYVQTYACVSGDYTYGECFSEAWIRNGRRGALAHIASSVNSYWTEDDTLERRVYDCMFDSSFHWIMGGYNRAKLIYFEQMGHSGMTRRYLEMYNLMGDGAIDVYAGVPRTLSVSYPPVIPMGSYPLTVRVSEGKNPVRNALVGVTARDDTTLFAAGYTDASGEVTLVIHTTVPDSVFVTVTGHNLEPHLGACLALPSSGPYVMYLNHVVDDSAGGNNDGIVNPGETINLPMWVKNWGSAPAVGVETRLRTGDQSVTLRDSVKQFGTIAAGDSAQTGAVGFGFSVSAACTNNHPMRFIVRSRDNLDSIWETPLTLFVGAPVLDYAAHEVNDPPPGGNGNGMLEPGETGNLVVVLRNLGRGHAYGATAKLRSGDSRLVVLDSLGSFSTINRDTLGSNVADPFRVEADASIPRETEVPCTLIVSVGETEWVRVFTLEIGALRTCDPIPDNDSPARYYAYDVTDTLYTEAPVFDWLDIKPLGTRLPITGDDQTVQLDLPPAFGPFYFYGRRFTRLSVCGNGFIAPGQTTRTAYNNTQIPTASASTMLALLWDDLYPPTSGGIWWYHDEASHRFIIQFDSMPTFSNRDIFDWYQLVIYDTTRAAPDGNSVFEYHYLTASSCGSATVGINDSTTVIGIQHVFDNNYHRAAAPLVPGMAIRFTTVEPRVGIAERAGDGGPAVGFRLEPSRPNPMRGAAHISFSLPYETEVRLSVYDASGRRVRELLRGAGRTGRQTVTWDGRDDAGRAAARGVYLYRLEAGGRSISRKLILTD